MPRPWSPNAARNGVWIGRAARGDLRELRVLGLLRQRPVGVLDRPVVVGPDRRHRVLALRLGAKREVDRRVLHHRARQAVLPGELLVVELRLRVDRRRAEVVREAERVADLVHHDLLQHGDVLVEVVAGAVRVGRFVREVIDRAAQHSEELVEAVARWIELGFPTEVPLADQRGLVARAAQQRRDRRMSVRDPDLRRSPAERLLETHAQALRITARDERAARGRADRCGCVVARELEPLSREPVEYRRLVVGAAIAAQVAVAEVVGQDEHHVGPRGLLRMRGPRAERRDCGRSDGGTENVSASHVVAHRFPRGSSADDCATPSARARDARPRRRASRPRRA